MKGLRFISNLLDLGFMMSIRRGYLNRLKTFREFRKIRRTATRI